MNDHFENNDLKTMNEILDSVSEKLPKLIRGIIGSLYSMDAGREMGKAIGSFYQELVASGFPEKDALEMSKQYMISLKSLSDVVKDETDRAKK